MGAYGLRPSGGREVGADLVTISALLTMIGLTGYASEIIWLTRVAQAYHQSPVAAETLNATEHLTVAGTSTQTVGDLQP